jgi:chromatin segregation and condensation protein Rec8/ScpA/Scc1 (kleisin family)
VIPSDLVAEIDELVGRRSRSRFLTELAAQEVKRLRLLRALERPAPAWKAANHPELKDRAAAWIRRLRRQDEARYRTRSKR